MFPHGAGSRLEAPAKGGGYALRGSIAQCLRVCVAMSNGPGAGRMIPP